MPKKKKTPKKAQKEPKGADSAVIKIERKDLLPYQELG